MKALVVDDSVVFRMAITTALQEAEQISSVKSVRNGEEGIKFLRDNPDTALITLDLEMPVMDGISAIREIRKFNKQVFILVFSSFSRKGAEKTVEALSLGANDFVTKQELGGTVSIENSLKMIRESLIPKVVSFLKSASRAEPVEIDVNVLSLVQQMTIKPKLIVIGSSTGGPEALSKLFSMIKEKVTIPMLMVQHMPPFFTEKLAGHLSSLCKGVDVMEAGGNEKLEAGKCYLAPGDYHMVYKNGAIKLNQDEKVCYVRPSLDVLLDSLADNFDGKILSIVLTGMGSDGAEGNKKLNKRGDYLFVQDKQSSVIWGMPGAVKTAIPSAHCLNLEDLALMLNEIFKRL
jgi:two-component system chemotaxis response regulator CheB